MRDNNEDSMLKLAHLAAVGLLISFGTAQAQTAQQSLMATCNKEATGKKGDERKQFMSACLSNGKKRQQEKMKTCNAEAKDMKGDARKKFMSECLKK